VSRERRDVRPASRRELRQVAREPGVAQSLDGHRPPIALVGEREGGGRFARDVANGRAEADQRREQRVAVGGGAARDDASRDAEALQRARAVVGTASDAGRSIREQVAREISDERDHALASMTLLRTAERASAASTNAAAKLGSDAPPQGSACGCVCPTMLVHQLGPCGESH
jgi:hypothetical protein